MAKREVRGLIQDPSWRRLEKVELAAVKGACGDRPVEVVVIGKSDRGALIARTAINCEEAPGAGFVDQAVSSSEHTTGDRRQAFVTLEFARSGLGQRCKTCALNPDNMPSQDIPEQAVLTQE